MNVQGGRHVYFFNICVAEFELKPHTRVVFMKCPRAYQNAVLQCINEYAEASQAISILANLSNISNPSDLYKSKDSLNANNTQNQSSPDA